MTVITLLRHGNTFDLGDTVLRVGRATDFPLSFSGKAQAIALGAYFKSKDIRFDAIFAAPLRRTQETAELVTVGMPERGSVQAHAVLTEIHYGPDEGKPEAEVIARIGQTALTLWENEGQVPPGWQVDPKALTAAWHGFFQMALARWPDGHLLAVTSNGVARFALESADTVPAGISRKLRTCAFGTVQVSPETIAVTAWDQRVEPLA